MDELSWALVMDSLGSVDRVMDSGVPLFHTCSSRVFLVASLLLLEARLTGGHRNGHRLSTICQSQVDSVPQSVPGVGCSGVG